MAFQANSRGRPAQALAGLVAFLFAPRRLMNRRLIPLICVFLTLLLAGCGGSRVTGKFSNQDKPKPVADK
jgi:hypothetical protein